jgi:hypothetical protein
MEFTWLDESEPMTLERWQEIVAKLKLLHWQTYRRLILEEFMPRRCWNCDRPIDEEHPGTFYTHEASGTVAHVVCP